MVYCRVLKSLPRVAAAKIDAQMNKQISYQLLLLCSDVVEARRGQTHLGTYFSTRSQARCIQALLRKFFLAISFGLYLTGQLHRLFWRRRFCFDPYNGLQTLSKPFIFFSHQAPYTRKRITLANALYHQCLQCRRAQALFNLPLHHCFFVKEIGLTCQLFNIDCQALMEVVYGIRVVVSGDRIDTSRHGSNLLIMNHRTRLDWMFFWCVLFRGSYQNLFNQKISLKDQLKSLPGLGMGQFSTYLFSPMCSSSGWKLFTYQQIQYLFFINLMGSKMLLYQTPNRQL